MLEITTKSKAAVTTSCGDNISAPETDLKPTSSVHLAPDSVEPIPTQNTTNTQTNKQKKSHFGIVTFWVGLKGLTCSV